MSVVGLVSITALFLGGARVDAQLILNEANAVSADSYVETDLSKRYEGYDYGVVPHSGNNNAPNSAVNPGNPFAMDLDVATPGMQQSLPNGWSLANATGWGRIQGNGGDWIELVLTEDHTDLRGYTLFWENDDGPIDGMVGTNPGERGFVKFTRDQSFADLRAGTIITLSEDSMIFETRDKYPTAPSADNMPPGPLPHTTGHVYDLSTNTSFNPFSSDDWHVHYHVDETLTDVGMSTQYFGAYSDMKSDNDAWRMRIFNASNTTIVAEAESPGAMSDLTSGIVHGPVGESAPNYGTATGAGGINNQELLALVKDPVSGASNANYEDVDFSTFGMPNMFNVDTESGLDGVQDFAPLRDPVLNNTFDWTADPGAAPFAVSGNWTNARTGAAAGAGPTGVWTARINNTAGGDSIAQVSANAEAAFATIMADAGTMTLDVGSSATLDIGAATGGRLLVMDGGRVHVDGVVATSTLEVFAGGTVSGSGLVSGDLVNSSGVVAPGSSAGTLSIDGDFVQYEGTLAIDLNGVGAGMFDMLAIAGAATLSGELDISLGFAPADGATFTILTAASVTSDLALTGDIAGFTLLQTPTSLVLAFAGPSLSPDLNMDGRIDIFDVAIVSNNWGSTGAPGAVTGDANQDGVVDIFDVALISNHWNPGGGSATSVPEPATLTWGVLAMIAIVALPSNRPLRS